MIAILTGDIINSRELKDSNEWIVPFKEAFNSLGNEPKNWEIFRGDSFQLEVAPENALYVAIQLKTTAKNILPLDVRIAIGIGEKEYDSENITESNGEAFINSGEQFDELKKVTLAIKSPWKEVDEQLNLSLELALLTMDNWSQNSAEIFKLSMKNQKITQKELGDQLGITQGRVSERQKRAGFDEIMKLESHYRKLISAKV
ncbi:MAG: SatD family protein [Cyclobacteriaceae bacterium]